MADIAVPLDQDWLNQAATCNPARHDRYRLTTDYYLGFDRPSTGEPLLTDRARAYLERSGLSFSENFCETLIDVYAERLQVEAFTADDKDDLTTAAAAQKSDDLTVLEAWISSAWALNRMDAKQGQVHTAALVKGDAFLIVDWDADRKIPRFSVNQPGNRMSPVSVGVGAV